MKCDPQQMLLWAAQTPSTSCCASHRAVWAQGLETLGSGGAVGSGSWPAPGSFPGAVSSPLLLAAGCQAWDGPAWPFGEDSLSLQSLTGSCLQARAAQGTEGKKHSSAIRCDPGRYGSGGPSSQRALCPQLPLAGAALSSPKKGTMAHCAEQKRAPCSASSSPAWAQLRAPSPAFAQGG